MFGSLSKNLFSLRALHQGYVLWKTSDKQICLGIKIGTEGEGSKHKLGTLAEAVVIGFALKEVLSNQYGP